MRRRDFRGEKEWRGAWESMRVWISWRQVGWKIEGSRRFWLGNSVEPGLGTEGGRSLEYRN